MVDFTQLTEQCKTAGLQFPTQLERGFHFEEYLSEELLSVGQVLAVVKPDCLAEGGFPIALDTLYSQGFSLVRLYPITFKQEDGYLMYGRDIEDARKQSRTIKYIAAAENIEGNGFIIQLRNSFYTGMSLLDRLDEVKGKANEYNMHTVRGKLCLPIPPDLLEQEYLRQVTQTRLHTPRDYYEHEVIYRILQKHYTFYTEY